MSQVLDPQKELRFARSRQALSFAVLGALFLSATVTLLLVTYTVDDLAELPFPGWLGYAFFLPVALCLWLSYYCIRHPYLIISPIGVEVFPLWKPIKNFQLIEWGNVVIVENDESNLTVHYNKEKTAGVVLTLSPLTKNSRILLMRAFEGVMEQRNKKL